MTNNLEDGVPEYATAEYDAFERGIDWTIDQLQKVLGVKTWCTSGGGTETLEGDVQAELRDLLKAAAEQHKQEREESR